MKNRTVGQQPARLVSDPALHRHVQIRLSPDANSVHVGIFDHSLPGFGHTLYTLLLRDFLGGFNRAVGNYAQFYIL